jgi:hypothetical protein
MMQKLPLKNNYFFVPTDPLARAWSYDVPPPTREEVMDFWAEKLFRLHTLTDMFFGKDFSLFPRGMIVPETKEERMEWIEERITMKSLGYSPGLFPCFFCSRAFHKEHCHLVKLVEVDPDGSNSSDNIWNYFPACAPVCRHKRDGIIKIFFRTRRHPFEKELYLEYQDDYRRLEAYLMENVAENFVTLIKHARKRHEGVHRNSSMDHDSKEYEPLL